MAASTPFLPSGDELVALTSSRVVVEGQLGPATIVFSPARGTILEVLPCQTTTSDFSSYTQLTHHDVSPHVIMPGLVDAHVHLNEPGPRTNWEGFDTGTRAAVCGGVTTVIDMPLNCIPPTTTVAALHEKTAAAKPQIWCDVGFYGGVIPANVGQGELKRLVQAGVRGFKGFLCDSGVPEFPAIGEAEISLAMHELKNEATTLMFHAEAVPATAIDMSNDVQSSEPPLQPTGQLHKYQTFLDSRPPDMEMLAISQILSLAHLAPELPLHIVHLSAAECIEQLRAARKKGVKVTAETCYHYLALTGEDIQDGDARYKCCPPVRGKKNQDMLWQELLRPDNSVIGTVVSDHSPCTADLKMLPNHIPGSTSSPSTSSESPGGDFFKAWGGISSLGLGLSILNTARTHYTFNLTDIVRWCAENTAKQVGLEHRKGKLAKGYDCDICVFDDSVEYEVTEEEMHFRNKCSPYRGRRLKGVVVETWVAGRRVFGREGFDGGGPLGRLLLEPLQSSKSDM